MSSAILYLAIIAIWACVLIPRWLKRDSVRGAFEPAQLTTTAQLATASDSSATTEVADSVPDDIGLSGTTGFREDTSLTDHTGRTDSAPVPGPSDETEDADTSIPEPMQVTTEESRRRIMKARRRLLWMMLGLEAAGGALAGTGLAAWWVIAPPTVTLVGYLVLLREAAQADAEVDAREREAQEAAEAAARERARQAREARTERTATPPPAPAIPVAYAAAPVPEDYEDLGPGRDFTPGLRYASARDTADHEAYDQYTENRLRAVGD